MPWQRCTCLVGQGVVPDVAPRRSHGDLFPYPSVLFVCALGCSIHIGHDDLKDKPFELELSWVCEESGWRHERVAEELRAGAVAWAKSQIEAEELGDSDSD